MIEFIASIDAKYVIALVITSFFLLSLYSIYIVFFYKGKNHKKNNSINHKIKQK